MNDAQRYTFYYLFIALAILGGGYYLIAFVVFADTYYEHFEQQRLLSVAALAATFWLATLLITQLRFRKSKDVWLRRAVMPMLIVGTVLCGVLMGLIWWF